MVFSSPVIARAQAMLRPHDRYVINRDRILGEAIRAIDDEQGQQPFERPALTMPGRPLFEEMVKWLEESRDKGLFMPHDVNVGTEMARIVTGGDVFDEAQPGRTSRWPRERPLAPLHSHPRHPTRSPR